MTRTRSVTMSGMGRGKAHQPRPASWPTAPSSTMLSASRRKSSSSSASRANRSTKPGRLATRMPGCRRCAFPRPIPGMVSERVLVMERLPGVPYVDAAASYGDDLEGNRLLRLAIQGVLETTLVYGLFHGDLHAGNVLIDRGDAISPVYFGISLLL